MSKIRRVFILATKCGNWKAEGRKIHFARTFATQNRKQLNGLLEYFIGLVVRLFDPSDHQS